jgi:ribonuclease HI
MNVFYAVARGHSVGVVRTWRECQARTQGFSRAAFKKFDSLDKAEEYIRSYSASSSSKQSESVAAPSDGSRKRARIDRLDVYCDGASKGNGRKKAIAGSACYFDHNSKATELLQRTPGRQTNSRAELFGAALALHATLEIETVRLCTDSDYVIQGMPQIDTYRRNGWRISPDKPLANEHLWRLLAALVDKRKAEGLARVDIQHVLAHSGIAGNERADRLSVQATALAPLSGEQLAGLFPKIEKFDWALLLL